MLTLTPKEIHSTWLETDGWETTKTTCLIKASGGIARKIQAEYGQNPEDCLWVAIDPFEKKAIQAIIRTGKEYIRADISPDIQKPLYDRLSHCAKMYSEGTENFLEAFIDTFVDSCTGKLKEVQG